LELKARLEEKVGVEAKIIVVQGSPFVDISSTDLRSRVQKRSTIRYQVPRAVEVFIEQKKLYK
jgi:nicotinic acid mononucleotide adenylyltransferase